MFDLDLIKVRPDSKEEWLLDALYVLTLTLAVALPLLLVVMLGTTMFFGIKGMLT